MMPVEKARDLILDRVRLMGTEKASLLRSIGRVLAEPVSAVRDHPPWDNSAMDGYAVRSGDTLNASEQAPASFEVIEEIPAGALPRKTVQAGQSSRIMTGAPLPEGADAVVRVEDARAEGSRVRIIRPAEAGENIRPRGEDIRAGHVVLALNTAIGPAEVGMLAALGRSQVLVYQRPRVAILVTGDELADLDEELTANKIRNSNGYALAAQVLEAGGIPVLLGIAKDTVEAVLGRLESGRSADLLLVSGGVSVGQYDFVKDVFERLGVIMVFWKVAVKPGEPLAFGTLDGKPIFGLPGNPVSTMVTFEEFVRPALRKMQGHALIFRPVIEAVLMERIAKKAGKTHFLRAVVEKREGRYEVRPMENQSSGVLTSMVAADGLLIFPSEAGVLEEGETVQVQLLDQSASGQAVPGYRD